MTQLKIDVTQKDIRYGKIGEAGKCAIARAGNRYMAKGYKLHIGVLDFSIVTDPYTHEIFCGKMPQSVRNYANRFDNHKDVVPEILEMDIPLEYLKGK